MKTVEKIPYHEVNFKSPQIKEASQKMNEQCFTHFVEVLYKEGCDVKLIKKLMNGMSAYIVANSYRIEGIVETLEYCDKIKTDDTEIEFPKMEIEV